jgi:hypothetical protein
MLDVASHLTFRIHGDREGRLTLRFRRLFENDSKPDRWQYDVALDDRPGDVVARLRDIAAQVIATERAELDGALARLQGEPPKGRKP